MPKLTKREFKLLVLAVVIIGGGSLFKWGVKPIMKSYRGLNKELAAKEQQWRNKKRLLGESARYKKALEQAKAEEQELSALIFTEDANAAQLHGLNLLTSELKQSGLKVRNKELRVETREEKDYNLLYYDFYLVGGFSQLTVFLKELNKIKKLFIVERLQLRKVKRESRLEINLIVRAVAGSEIR